MVAVPGVISVTIPVELTVPTAVLLLLHVPPEVASFKFMGNCGQFVAVPVIGLMVTITLTTVVI